MRKAGERLKMKGKSLRILILFLLIFDFQLLTLLHSTDIYLQIQRGEKITIGFPEFVSKTNSEPEKSLTREIQEVAKKDILFTRLFNLVENGPAVGTGRIDFLAWEKVGADLLISANVNLKEDDRKKGDGVAQMIAAVYEIPGGNPVFQKSYRTVRTNARQLAHQFVADFLFRFTGYRGVSQSKIAFCNTSTGFKELYLIDYDGENLKRLTADKNLAILPRWSPSGDEIAYTSFQSGNPDIYLYSMSRGIIKAISLRRGLNSCASFSPDGKQIVATLSHEGSPNLYLLDRQGKIIRRLTKVKAADTSASFSPDGQKIIFTSDRPGWPQIYMIDTDGSNLKRVTESGYCDAPVWSPTGDKIAYSRGTDKGKHDIIVQDLVSGNVIQLTENAGNNENPSFSPDGRFLVFSSTRDKKRELFIASVDGSIQKKLAEIPGNSFTPSWGP